MLARPVIAALLLQMPAFPAFATDSDDSAETVMKRHRAMTAVTVQGACASEADPGEILVCGQRNRDKYRVATLDAAGGAIGGDRGALPRGADARDERAAIDSLGNRCAHGGPGCGGGLDVIGIGRAIAGAIGKLRGQ